MAISNERKRYLQAKIDWEGGLEEYVVNYGPDPKDLEDCKYKELIDNYKASHKALTVWLRERIKAK